MFEGQLIGVCIAPAKKARMESHDEVQAVGGQGLAGDRYASKSGIQPSQEVTLIEEEAIDAAVRDYQLAISHSDTRRNLLTRNVPLNHLVNRSFQVGQVVLRGVELCEPCAGLERMTCEGIKQALLHRGGLRAQVIQGGTLRVGDRIVPA